MNTNNIGFKLKDSSNVSVETFTIEDIKKIAIKLSGHDYVPEETKMSLVKLVDGNVVDITLQDIKDMID